MVMELGSHNREFIRYVKILCQLITQIIILKPMQDYQLHKDKARHFIYITIRKKNEIVCSDRSL
jgi:hypothetical protein